MNETKAVIIGIGQDEKYALAEVSCEDREYLIRDRHDFDWRSATLSHVWDEAPICATVVPLNVVFGINRDSES